MTYASNRRISFCRAGAAALFVVIIAAAGCKNQPAPRTDQQILSDVQAKISGEGALNSQSIQVSVVNGVATLSGTVTDEASRALAGNDSGTVSGVRTVVNNLTVQPASPAPAVVTAAPQPAPSAPPAPKESSKRHPPERSPERPQEAVTAPAVAPVQPATQAAAAPPPPPPQPQAPPPPPKPVVKQVTIPAGTVIPVRITETLNSKDAQPNEAFHGSLAADLGTQGVIAIPHGAAVMGRIVDARDAGHLSGSSLLSIELTQLTARGKTITLVTDTLTRQGAARGKNTAEKAGVGAGVGAIIGALAGGGKGAAIGAAAGGAAGTGVNAATRGEQVVIPTETLINFRLQSPITLTVTLEPNGEPETGDAQDPQLQHR